MRVGIDLAAAGGGGDGAADTVVINASPGADVIVVTANGSTLTVSGLAAEFVISNFEDGIDHLVINSLAGDDVLDGGPDNDVLSGGLGNDMLLNGEVAIQLIAWPTWLL